MPNPASVPRVPRFNLNYDGTTNWSALLTLFEFNARKMGHSDHEKFWALCNSLSGQAVAAVASLPSDLCESQDYNSLKRILSKYFGVSSTPQVVLLRLLPRKQAPDESLRDYANSIRSLAAAAFPSDPMEAQNQAISAFIGGLTNKTTAAVLLGNPPADIAAAVELADKLDYPTLLEAAFSGEAVRTASSSTSSSRYPRPA